MVLEINSAQPDTSTPIADLKSYFYYQLFILELDRSDSVNKKMDFKYW